MTIFLRKVFCLGGIYDEWQDKETGKIYRSFTIITTEANKLMSEIHNTQKRMPVILSTKNEEKLWLNSENLKIIKELMGSYDIQGLRAEIRDKSIKN